MKSFGISPEIYGYVTEHMSPAADSIAGRLGETTRERFGDRAGMNIGEDQGRFMEMLAAAMGATMIVEVGTFTGMSALWLARGLAAEGRLICFDLTDTYAATATEAWAEAGLAERIELRFGPAVDGLLDLPNEPHIDLAFIDADKPNYVRYLDLLLPRMRPTGVILVDNVLWSGQVVDSSDSSVNTEAIRSFNDHVGARSDCDAVILTIGDGVTMIRPRT
ncbi:MAG: O-methyltransferase [Ilumatobacter sp.]